MAQLKLLSVLGLAAFFGLWTLIAISGLVQPQFLPTPLAVAEEFWRLLQIPFAGYTLEQHLLSSLGRFGLGFALAAVIGVPLGLAMGWFRTLDAIVTPLFDALRFGIAGAAWIRVRKGITKLRHFDRERFGRLVQGAGVEHAAAADENQLAKFLGLKAWNFA